MRALANTEDHLSGPSRNLGALLRRPWFTTISLASALCAAYLVGALINWGAVGSRSLYANLGMVPIGLAAAMLALSASGGKPDRRSQWAWRLVGVGLAFFWAGDVLYFVYENVLGQSAFPSMADVGYLAFYPLVYAGLLALPTRPVVGKRRTIGVAVSFILVLAGAALVVGLFLLPTLRSSEDGFSAYWLSVGYPLGDLLLIGGIVHVFVRRASGSVWGVRLLCAGLLAGFVADMVSGYESVQGTLVSGGFPDAARMVAWALFAWAGYAELSDKRERRANETIGSPTIGCP